MTTESEVAQDITRKETINRVNTWYNDYCNYVDRLILRVDRRVILGLLTRPDLRLGRVALPPRFSEMSQ